MQLATDFSLTHYNSFRIPAKAKQFVDIQDERMLPDLFSRPEVQNQPLLVLGGGSNILFTKDFDGTVVKMSIKGIAIEEEASYYTVTCGAGEIWNDLVRTLVNKNIAGLENLSLIPGTVGASPIQNIGAYGVELKDSFYELRAFNIQSRTYEVFSNSACQFGYRDSVFKNRYKGIYLVTEVTYRLNKSNTLNLEYGAIRQGLEAKGISEPSIKDVSETVSAIRVGKLPDPSTIGNAGSFFKNPVITLAALHELKKRYPEIPFYPTTHDQCKVAAGWLIEQCGLKGKQIGNVGTWPQQALVIVNEGGATGDEVVRFSKFIQQSVEDKFSIQLEPEVNIL